VNTEQQRYGLLFDVDGVLRLGTVRRQLGRIRAMRSMSFRDRRSILAMPRLIRALSTDLGGAPVFYMTALPIGLARPITNLLIGDGYPPGTLLLTGRGLTPRWVAGGSRVRKTAAMERLAERIPDLCWVLVGDDGGHDPRVFVDVALHRRDRVAFDRAAAGARRRPGQGQRAVPPGRVAAGGRGLGPQR
jgi:phosphatidate phosphatase APP1